MNALVSAPPYPGNLGHTAFATSCTSGSHNCIAPTADPGGAWLRAEPAAHRLRPPRPPGSMRPASAMRASAGRPPASASLGQLAEMF